MPTISIALSLGLNSLDFAHAKDAEITPVCDQQLFDKRAVDTMDPSELYGPLFVQVQTSSLFKDSKFFVDMEPRFQPFQIMNQYLTTTPQSEAELRQFVIANFAAPDERKIAEFHIKGAKTAADYIHRLWPLLTRPPTGAPKPGSSMIEINIQHVAPGGRFRELYYWDSYFTQLGLLEDQQFETFDSMIRVFARLLKKHGRIFNGTRDYYRGRSQPPYFSLMVSLWQARYGDQSATQFLPALKKEHEFWMTGARAVSLDDGVLNRYWNDRAVPRPEAYREDVDLAQVAAKTLGRQPEDVYRDLSAAAESGWDFSTRWFADPANFATIQTTSLLPIDLNSLLWQLERKIADLSRINNEPRNARKFQNLADARARLIHKYFYDTASGTFRDYNWRTKRQSTETTAAMVTPLFLGLANPEQAKRVLDVIERDFLKRGGVKTTLRESDQQWDGVKGWAPNQWQAYVAARRYHRDAVAEKIRRGWLHTNDVMYALSGEMKEKYNVEDLNVLANGGEYEPQYGFGWSNGVYKAFLNPEPLLLHLLRD